MSIPNQTPHKFDPSNKGRCKTLVGGRRTGYEHCALGEDAEVHTKFAPPTLPAPPKWHIGSLRISRLGELKDHYELSIYCDECKETFDMKLEKAN